MTTVLIVYVLAAMRLTRLLNFDTVLDRPRIALVRLVRGNPTVVYFITCPWCVGMWVSLATSWLPLYHADNPVVRIVGLALATSMVIGLAAPLSSDPDMHLVDGAKDDAA